MRTVLLTLFFVSGIVFVLTIMLMSPKGGLGFGMGGASSSNEYGSQKSLEYTLKKVALVSFLVFIVVTIALPLVQEQPAA